MRKIRVFVEQTLCAGETVELPAASSHYLTRVLRLGVGDGFTLINDSGLEYSAQITVPKHAATVVTIASGSPIERESPLDITLLQALLRTEKMSQVLQKSCELGVRQITPILTERTEVRLSDEREEKRLNHWREVLISAIEQCGRTRLPVLNPPRKVNEIAACEGALGLVLDPTAERSLREIQPAGRAIQIAIGPEGGFTEAEVKLLLRLGYVAVRFGPRILRTETAGPAVIAALQAQFGDC